MMQKEQVLNILALKQTHTLNQIATTLSIPLSTVRYWIKRAKAQSLTIPPNQKAGRKPLDLTN